MQKTRIYTCQTEVRDETGLVLHWPGKKIHQTMIFGVWRNTESLRCIGGQFGGQLCRACNGCYCHNCMAYLNAFKIPLKTLIHNEEAESMGEVDTLKPEAFYSVNDRIPSDILDKLGGKRENIRAIYVGEKRMPKKGEWYLSGAIIEAYCAFNDLSAVFPIAKLVQIKKITITRIVKEM